MRNAERLAEFSDKGLITHKITLKTPNRRHLGADKNGRKFSNNGTVSPVFVNALYRNRQMYFQAPLFYLSR